jgi:hypothetical protein
MLSFGIFFLKRSKTMPRASSFFLPISLAALLPSAAFAQWGDVKLTFVYDGKPAAAATIPGAAAFCAAKPPVDETWVVNPKGGGVRDVVVYLLADKSEKLPIHPDFDKAKGTAVRIDNENCRFEPRVAIKYTNQDLILGNKDGFGHNVKADFFGNLSFNLLIPAKDKITRGADKDKLNIPEAGACPLSCGIHPFMKGYLFIQAHPYSGVSDADGNLTIKNAPEGEWTFVMWHIANVKAGKLNGVAKEWPKGRIKIKVGPGVNTVGTIAFK